jgi:hypothetical protein
MKLLINLSVLAETARRTHANLSSIHGLSNALKRDSQDFY